MRLSAFQRLRRERYRTFFSSTALCITGMLILPAFVFNPDIISRVYQFLLFYIFLVLSGKKNNIVMILIVMLTIIIFNVLIPFGRVLFSIGAFKVTYGALSIGIKRAVTLEGLIMLSKVSIRDDLSLPGIIGELIGESFRLFNHISERKSRINKNNIVSSLDDLLLELSGESFLVQSKKVSRTKASGYIILFSAVFLSWLPYIAAGAGPEAGPALHP